MDTKPSFTQHRFRANDQPIPFPSVEGVSVAWGVKGLLTWKEGLMVTGPNDKYGNIPRDFCLVGRLLSTAANAYYRYRYPSRHSLQATVFLITPMLLPLAKWSQVIFTYGSRSPRFISRQSARGRRLGGARQGSTNSRTTLRQQATFNELPAAAFHQCGLREHGQRMKEDTSFYRPVAVINQNTQSTTRKPWNHPRHRRDPTISSSKYHAKDERLNAYECLSRQTVTLLKAKCNIYGLIYLALF